MFASSNAVLRITITQPADTDHDGIPDSWEIAHSLNPGDSADGSLDNDRDGRTNFQEYVANTNPQQSNSIFRIAGAIRDASGHNVVSWTTSGGTRYRLQFVDRNPPDTWNFADLVRPIGIEMDSHPIGSPNAMTFVDDYSSTGTPAPGTSRYYRIRVVR
jgi:G3E family GTPase